MNLGQLLGGAGNVAVGMRSAEQASRLARQDQLTIEERNRLDKLRQEMLGAPMPEAQVPQFAPMGQLPVVNAPAAPMAPAFAGVYPTGPGTRYPIAGLQMTAGELAEQPLPTGVSDGFPTAAPTPPAAPMTQSQADRLALLRAPTAVLDVVQAPAAGALNLVTAAGEQVVNVGGRLINAVTGREVAPTDVRGPRFSYTPFYDRFVRQQEQAAAGTTPLPAPTPTPGIQQRIAESPNLMPSIPRIGAPTAPQAGAPAGQLPNRQQLSQAMVTVESGGRPGAVSPAGAVGLMQVKPSTAMKPGLGLQNIFDFAQQMGVQVGKRNEAEATRLLKDPVVGKAYGDHYMDGMLNRYDNNMDHALVAYNAGPGFADRWIKAGADPDKLPKETREYLPKVKTAMGMGGGGELAATPTPVRSASDFYLANPQSIPLDMQRAMQQRQEVARLAGMYQRAGMGMQFMEARGKLMELDNGMTYLQGMQGIQEFTLANDPRRLAAVWSQYAGVPVGIQPRTDGNYDIVVNGRVTKSGITTSEISDSARSAFDQTYRQQKGQASAQYNMEAFKSKLKRDEETSKQYVQMIREVAVAKTQGNIALSLEWLKANAGWKYQATGAGDGTVIIAPPGAAPMLYNPSGRTIEINGVKVQSNEAYPIAGLPTYGGVKP